MPKHYVVGDIHGEYSTLLALVEKLPKDAKLIFVGDLIDRGLQSREVVSFVRNHAEGVVLGNHEALFCKYGLELLAYLEGKKRGDEIDQRWHHSGRFETFLSYGVVSISSRGVLSFSHNQEAVELLREDITWMRRNPLYIELDVAHSSGRPVVVSHSNISKVWAIRHDPKQRELFVRTTLWTREHELDDSAQIFNIFGHSPQMFAPKVEERYACVDTGCCYSFREGDYGYGLLSAYCLETGEVVMVENRVRSNRWKHLKMGLYAKFR